MKETTRADYEDAVEQDDIFVIDAYVETLEAETTQLKERIAELEAEQHMAAACREDYGRMAAELQELKSGVISEFEGQLCGEGDAVPFFHNNEWLISDLLENHQNKHITVTIREKKQ